jgi:AcrR family transcriptional regulator
MDDAADVELPRGIALAWGVASNPSRGPKRELSIEGIVEAAITIADASGLAAVSMASIATALGYTTMSLYRYVSAKDDLILLMQEAGMGLPPLTVTEAEGWRDGLMRWYRASLATYSEHPWLLDIPAEGVPSTPNYLGWLDAGLQVLDSTPLDARQRVAAVVTLSGHSRAGATIARSRERAESDPDVASAALVAELVTAEQFPSLFPAIEAGAFRSADNPYEFGVSRLLDGLELLISQLQNGDTSPPEAAPPTLDPSIAREEQVKRARQTVKDAEGRLRDARQKEREAIAKAHERAAKRG